MQIDKKHKKLFNVLLQALIFGGIIYFFYKRIGNEDVTRSIKIFIASFNNHSLLWLIVLLLMPVNWALEAIKWKVLCKPLMNISFWSAFKGVVTGLSVGFATPRGWGDYVGRIAIIHREKREKLIGSLFFGKMTQLFITVVFGITGLVMFFEVRPYLYLWYFIVFLVVSVVIAFNKSFYRLLKPYLHKIKRFFSIIKSYTAKTILCILSLSGLRYIVFTTQFLLIMLALKVDLDLVLLFSGITWIFLIKSIVPSFNFLSDLGIREVSAVLFFDNYLTDLSPVISATFIIWVINIFVPAVVGIFFIFSIKVFR